MEINRRDALAAVLLPLLGARGAASQATAQGARPGNAPVFEHDLPNISMEDWQVTALEITLAPGSVGTAHQHPGFVLVYVLQGAIVTKISDQPETVYTVGQMFYEQPGATHEMNRNASTTEAARFLALIFAKKGLPLTNRV